MRFADLPLRPTERTLRQFAVLWLACFGGLAVWQVARHGVDAWAIGLAAASSVGAVGWFWPALLRPIFVGWIVLVFPVGWLISHLVLGVLFFGLFTPVAGLFRLLGRDALMLRPRPDRGSYWTAKPQATDLRQYLRQF